MRRVLIPRRIARELAAPPGAPGSEGGVGRPRFVRWQTTEWKPSLLIYAGFCAFVVGSKCLFAASGLRYGMLTRGDWAWASVAAILSAGLLGVALGPFAGVPGLWDRGVTVFQRFVPAAVAGGVAALGTVAVGVMQGWPDIRMPQPFAVLASLGAAGLFEVKVVLAGLTAGVWLLSTLVLRGRWQTAVFWILAAALALVEPYFSVSRMMAHGQLGEARQLWWGSFYFAWLFLAGLVPMAFYRRWGFVSVLTFEWSRYLLWHLVWPPF